MASRASQTQNVKTKLIFLPQSLSVSTRSLSHEMTTPLAQLTKPENCHHLCSSICLTLYIQPYAKFFLLIYYFSISQNYSLLSTLEATTLVFTITVSCLEGCQLQWWSASILAPSSTFSTLQPRELSIMQI